MFCILRVVPRIGVDILCDLGAVHRRSLQQFVADRCLINVTLTEMGIEKDMDVVRQKGYKPCFAEQKHIRMIWC